MATTAPGNASVSENRGIDGAAAFLTFLIVDLVAGGLYLLEIVIRLAIVVVLARQAKILNARELSQHQLNR